MPGSGVMEPGRFLQPTTTQVSAKPITNRLKNFVRFIVIFLFRGPYLAQLGCELLPEIRATSLTCFVGTSSTESTRPLAVRRAKITVRELGAQDGSSPLTNNVAVPPCAGTTQISKPFIIAVKTIHLSSGDQSGSVGLETPPVEMR